MTRREAEIRKICHLAFAGKRPALRLLETLRAKAPPLRGGGVVVMPLSYFMGDKDEKK